MEGRVDGGDKNKKSDDLPFAKNSSPLTQNI